MHSNIPARPSADLGELTGTSADGNWPTPGQPGPRADPNRRALVLAGGGAAGNAWQLGVVAGLAAEGVELASAELVVGTSAGATAAAQITSGTPAAQLYRAVLTATPRAVTGSAPQADAERARRSGAAAMTWSDEIIAASDSAADMRRRMGAAALEHLDAPGPNWRDIVAARLPSHRWPDQALQVVAVDARDGTPVVFDRDGDVDLVDAVAASTSATQPYRIGENWFINGGYRRSENADLAAGSGRVLVLSPFGGRSRMPAAWGMDLATQVRELRGTGSEVECVFPDPDAGDVFGPNALDPSTRHRAAESGYAQGVRLAATVDTMWS